MRIIIRCNKNTKRSLRPKSSLQKQRDKAEWFLLSKLSLKQQGAATPRPFKGRGWGGVCIFFIRRDLEKKTRPFRRICCSASKARRLPPKGTACARPLFACHRRGRPERPTSHQPRATPWVCWAQQPRPEGAKAFDNEGLLPFQGEGSASIYTQGAALGY